MSDDVDYLIFTDDITEETSLIVSPAYEPGYVVEFEVPIEDADGRGNVETELIQLSREETEELIKHLTQLLDSDDGL